MNNSEIISIVLTTFQANMRITINLNMDTETKYSKNLTIIKIHSINRLIASIN